MKFGTVCFHFEGIADVYIESTSSTPHEATTAGLVSRPGLLLENQHPKMSLCEVQGRSGTCGTTAHDDGIPDG
jgi:hypothetical protein